MIETLGKRLSTFNRVYFASDKKNQLLRLLDMIWALIRNRKELDYVLIDTFSTRNFYYALASSQVCRLLNLPYIPIVHGGNLPYRLKSNPRLSSYIFGHAWCIVAPSNYLKYSFEKYNYKSTLIPNFIDISLYPYTLRKKIRPRLFWVRSFHKLYQPEIAIQVLHMLLPEYPDAELCMVGPDKDGSMEISRKLAADLGILSHVTFTGLLSQKEWAELSTQYDIFINTTSIDNTPVSVIEAMALGLPIVSTSVGGIPYLLNDKQDALLVPSGDAKAMKTAITSLLTEERLASSLAQHAREKVQSFDWPIVEQHWKRLLQ